MLNEYITRFLILESDPLVREQLERLVEGSGLGQAISVGTIREALDALDYEPVDIVIAAWNLSGQATGLNLLQMIRAEDRFRKLGFVLLSSPSEDEPSKVQAARAAHVDGYLLKPVNEVALTQLLREVGSKVTQFQF